jgi:hypothetical protein
MDLDKFIEQDIVDFLESELAKKGSYEEKIREDEYELYHLQKDYSGELDRALAVNDLNKAKLIFDEVKNIFLNTPPNTFEKKRVYKILEELHRKIKNHLEKHKHEKNLFQELQEFEALSLQGIESQEKALTEQATQPANEEYKKKAKEAIQASLDAIQQLTKQGRLKPAIEEYKRLKATFKTYPDSEKQEKVKLFEDVIAAYYQIKKLKESQVENIKEYIHASMRKAYRHLEEKQVGLARQEYKNIKAYYDKLDQKGKRELQPGILGLYQAIVRAQNRANVPAEEDKDLAEANKDISAMKKAINDNDIHQANFWYLSARHHLSKASPTPQKSALEAELDQLFKEIHIRASSQKFAKKAV